MRSIAQRGLNDGTALGGSTRPGRPMGSRVRVPVVISRFTLVPLEVGVTGLAEPSHDVDFGRPAQLRVTDCENPPNDVTVKMNSAGFPAGTVALGG
jgi:hypothetical protein